MVMTYSQGPRLLQAYQFKHVVFARCSNDLVSEKGNVATLSQNLTICNIKLEQRRLAQLAQTEESHQWN